MTDAKILEDTIGVESEEGDEYRIVQLSAEYNQYNMEQVVARLRNGGTQTLITMHSQRKPKRYEITELEMDNLVAAWQKFKADLATLKAAQEAEKLAKTKEIWAEIARLADSIPGMEIIASITETWWNYGTQEEQPYTYVKVPAIGFERRYTLPEKILAGVKDAIEQYNNYVQLYEKHENEDWYVCTPKAKESGQNFLKQHREWLTNRAYKTAESPSELEGMLSDI